MLDRSDVEAGTRVPAHRPSRRREIVDAAIKVFAQRGFADASMQHVADEAGVVPTAVYYHFAGKDELFDVVLQAVIADVDERVEAARPVGDPLAALTVVVDTVWDWIEGHPDHARILYSHLPGATRQAGELQRQFEERHTERAYVYALEAPDGDPGSGERAHAAASLAVRTLIRMLIAIHSLRLDGGPLSRRSPRAMRRALQDVSQRIVTMG